MERRVGAPASLLVASAMAVAGCHARTQIDETTFGAEQIRRRSDERRVQSPAVLYAFATLLGVLGSADRERDAGAPAQAEPGR